MTHKFETPVDYAELKEFFDTLETLAYKLGVDVDDLLDEKIQKQSSSTIKHKNYFNSVNQKKIVSNFDTGNFKLTVFRNSSV
jgi:hypothetical protein